MSIRLKKGLVTSAAIAALSATSPAYGQESASTDLVITGSENRAQPLSGTINPFTGTINPFTGTINPFYGNITPFWGTINPFSGNITAFWGTLNPFTGTINPFTGTINPFSGTINPFTGTEIASESETLQTIGTYWQSFGTHWQGTEPLWTDPLRGLELTGKMSEIVTRTELLWGRAITSQTGKSFAESFLNPLFARYGVNPNDPKTLQALSADQRARFFIDWYDSLMRYSGMDRPDHWMRTVNWTPGITQQQGSGADSIIGLLDATAIGDPDIADNVTWNGGFNTTVAGHGVGVASLMVAAHDRNGVMGIAPNARVIAFNPFDSTSTASWSAIRDGVLSLASRNASVINMSLGVPGYTLHPDWRKVFFDPQVFNSTKGRVFVLAAGNAGETQTLNLRWEFARDPNLIIVGSVRVDGTISDFSNRPGTACLLDADVCRESLMNRFIVAPGELMLVPDGAGGFARRTGTSFAAPLVSGAITLLHDRWPWLANHPRETVDIILRSARDLGAPGTDPVYGRGLLDVAASQSPLSFNNLTFYEVRNGVTTARTASEVRSTGVPTTWEAEGVYFHLYEPIGGTFRDFTVPLSSQLTGSVRTLTGATEYFQRFVQGRLTDWIRNGTGGFTDTTSVEIAAAPQFRMSLTGSSPVAYLVARDGGASPHTALRIAEGTTGIAFTAGAGNGALALNGQDGLGLSSDYSRDGGVNPLLALASGGAFASIDLPIGNSTSIAMGVTQHQPDRSRIAAESQIGRGASQDVDGFDANAINVRLRHEVSSSLAISGSYARMRERNSLLGVQSREQTDLSHGAASETATLAASLDVQPGLTVALSGTIGRTRSAGDPEQGFTTRGHGIVTSAFALAATRQGVFGQRDAMRVSIAQPLHVERGDLTYSSVQVIDRQTGELGLVDQQINVSGQGRSVAGELLYSTPLLTDQGEIGLFGRAEVQTEGGAGVNRFAVGTRVSFRF